MHQDDGGNLRGNGFPTDDLRGRHGESPDNSSSCAKRGSDGVRKEFKNPRDPPPSAWYPRGYKLCTTLPGREFPRTANPGRPPRSPPLPAFRRGRRKRRRWTQTTRNSLLRRARTKVPDHPFLRAIQEASSSPVDSRRLLLLLSRWSDRSPLEKAG